MSSDAWDDARTRTRMGPSVLRAGNLVVEPDARRASLAQEYVELTHQEFEILALLMRRLNLIVPHTMICQAIWGSAGSRELKRLGVAISNLREKLVGLSPYTIMTVRSRGYGIVLGESSDTASADPIGMHDWHSHQYAHGWINAQRDDERAYLRKLVHLLPFDPDQPIRVLDIGAGYGSLTKLVLDAFPHSTVVVHDYSEPMLLEARLRLASASDYVSYARGDLMYDTWTRDLGRPFDAVISAIAIHNVRFPERIRAIYSEVFEILVPGGCFYNVDYVTPPGDLVARARRHSLLMDERFQVRQRTGTWPALREVETQVSVPTALQVRERDVEPASLGNQLAWLSEAGFSQVECFWHDGMRALMGAFKDQ